MPKDAPLAKSKIYPPTKLKKREIRRESSIFVTT